ncbi:MAG TPA: inorganic phosphate transporter [Ferruginibacter sp.]|nr:inorganic phosphate transporter [Ferruginibacter sp.]HPH92890.1 inorganic phosphate transporter [Ferruginibacter sp.]
MTLLIVIIALALIFDYINGFHDAANSIATIVSTKVLTPFQAVVWAAFFNFVAYFIFKDHAVANTIGKTVHIEYITLPVILAGLIAAIFWNLLTWWYGIPSSSSHTLIGGFAGAALTHAWLTKGMQPISAIVELKKISEIVLFIFLAPIIGMVISIFITIVTIMRNTWLKVGIIVLVAIGTWFLFAYFEQNKLKENLAKHYNIEKLSKVAGNSGADKAALEKATQLVIAATPLMSEYKKLGAEKLAEKVKLEVDPNADTAALAKQFYKADNSIIEIGILIMIFIFICAYIYSEKVRSPNAYRTAKMFKRLQLLSSGAFSIGHGGNDAQKVMGIIGAAFVAYNVDKYPDVGTALKELTWVPLACYTAIGLGTMSGGWKIVKTMGTKITKVTPLEGVAAETSGALTLFMTEQMGIPVSTTHTITGSIIGVGATKRLSAVRWGVTVNLLWAWILTIPVSAILAAISYVIVSFFLKP